MGGRRVINLLDYFCRQLSCYKNLLRKWKSCPCFSCFECFSRVFGGWTWLAIFNLRMHQKMYRVCLDAEDVEGSYFVFMRMHFRICEKASGSIKLCNQAEADVRPMHLDGLKILWPPAGNYQLIGSRFFMNFSWDLYLCTMKPEPRVDDNDIACKDNIKTLLHYVKDNRPG